MAPAMRYFGRDLANPLRASGDRADGSADAASLDETPVEVMGSGDGDIMNLEDGDGARVGDVIENEWDERARMVGITDITVTVKEVGIESADMLRYSESPSRAVLYTDVVSPGYDGRWLVSVSH